MIMCAEIKRIDCYDDKRFAKKVLAQHGAFVINEKVPCSVEIIGQDTALINCDNAEYFDLVINEFLFYAEHIRKFYANGELIKELAPLELFDISLADIQPSQFYVDEDKINAVKSFIKSADDIIVPLRRFGERYISLDGHTRLSVAVQNGYGKVKGFITQSDTQLIGFVKEAQKRSVFSPYDLKVLSHAEYDILWNKFCDDFLG